MRLPNFCSTSQTIGHTASSCRRGQKIVASIKDDSKMTRGCSRIRKQIYRPSTKSPKATMIPTHVIPSNVVSPKELVTNSIEVRTKNFFSLLVNILGKNNVVQLEKAKKKILDFDNFSETNKLSQNPQVVANPNGYKNSIHSLDFPRKLPSSKTTEDFDLNMIYSKKDGARVDVTLSGKNDVYSFQKVSNDSSGTGATSKETRSLTPTKELWSSPLDMVVPIWCVLGDFNVILSTHEATGHYPFLLPRRDSKAPHPRSFCF
ncbi:hypothetical protein PanWU01x14_169590 [Parasponia andersonii]|uniref:Uncharacterized protein n=1 Tax=Parasponia andersonii TaxID=3476 RepID=A0A2P5CAG1_PARAD|nr:hypothetical protein PanWU01x14_169590 [Parasponia andersonii]